MRATVVMLAAVTVLLAGCTAVTGGKVVAAPTLGHARHR